jgi:hypothetical protein
MDQAAILHSRGVGGNNSGAMVDGVNGSLRNSNDRKTGIERVLAALRNIEEAETPAPASPSTGPAKRKEGMTPEGRKRLSAALRKRWAVKKAAEGVQAANPQKPARRKARFTPEGRQRLAEAMRRRWAVKRTAAQAKSAADKPCYGAAEPGFCFCRTHSLRNVSSRSAT